MVGRGRQQRIPGNNNRRGAFCGDRWFRKKRLLPPPSASAPHRGSCEVCVRRGKSGEGKKRVVGGVRRGGWGGGQRQGRCGEGLEGKVGVGYSHTEGLVWVTVTRHRTRLAGRGASESRAYADTPLLRCRLVACRYDSTCFGVTCHHGDPSSRSGSVAIRRRVVEVLETLLGVLSISWA